MLCTQENLSLFRVWRRMVQWKLIQSQIWRVHKKTCHFSEFEEEWCNENWFSHRSGELSTGATDIHFESRKINCTPPCLFSSNLFRSWCWTKQQLPWTRALTSWSNRPSESVATTTLFWSSHTALIPSGTVTKSSSWIGERCDLDFLRG